MINGESNVSIDRVAMRVPEFCSTDPEVWFCLLERNFSAAKVTVDSTMFDYAAGALPPKYALEVRDILMKPPTSGQYDTLKKELLRRLTSSHEEKIRRLLEREEIGDRKPSQFLRHLRQLAGPSTDDKILRTLWMTRLPRNVQMILATQKNSELDQVADLADSVMEHSAASYQIASVNDSPNNSVDYLNTKLSQIAISLKQELSEIMRQEIAAFQQPMNHRFRSPTEHESRRRYQRRSRSRTRSSSRGHGRKICWYHWKFDVDAKRCIPPCLFKSENNTGSH